jgi:hypothetical protein
MAERQKLRVGTTKRLLEAVPGSTDASKVQTISIFYERGKPPGRGKRKTIVKLIFFGVHGYVCT